MTALIIHGHFYQPPRENPWTGTIDRQPSAWPWHDWNERIHDECYGPNAFAHIIGPNNTIEFTLNNYANISFNFGPTLLSWLEAHHPKTYQRILEADKDSVARLGHGNAIAQAYGHAILPLCNDRDRLTQVLWGLADFRFRFGREPESLWLPETACDDATLELLIEQGMRYVILAPDQAERVLRGEGESHSVADGSIDPRRAYQYWHGDHSGRAIAIFFYDGPCSRTIAFERVLSSSRMLVDMFKQAAQGGELVSVATDGETYGHHFKLGDLGLAHALAVEAREQEFQVTNYGEFLARNPPELAVQLKSGPEGEGTAWSCVHGVGRWIRDCGCHTGGEAGWHQQWRGPLRAALDFLRDQATLQFETVGSELLLDPWAARNAYIDLILDRGHSREEFLAKHSAEVHSHPDQMRALTLLEIQRNALLMYTSCGWFFSELSGIETLQIMKYAARVIELMDELGLPSPRARFLELMAEAESNIPQFGTGADLYLRFAEPAVDVAPSYL